ncbi:MAG: MBOAT family protein [Candidatus Ruminococcus intestinipullorum]|nr:MBOAT family protein [Candidatus Ruminococcus intestinipullorum]
MLFSSIHFLFVFLPITMLVYYLVPYKLKNFVMLIASLLFYAWGEPVYVILMILSILFNYVMGKDISERQDNLDKKKQSLIFAVVVNLLILGFFKYYGFLMDTINAIFPFKITYRQLPLPVGISFYTFQALSYVVDVYKGEVKSQKNLLQFALYIAMFPQLIAGPIVRYIDIEAQLAKRQIHITKIGQGAMYFIRGFAKKILIADTLGSVFVEILDMKLGTYSILTAWLGCISYAFQIYFDFSGYSDMAIGLGKMFGFEFKQNFHYPYISLSVSEFWRRWHISLSTWFREYVYIPLGGNRDGNGKTVRNLLIVWMLTGLWHGAAWNFLIWGFYYGVILVLEKFIWGRAMERWMPIVRRIYTLAVILFGWVLFFSPSLGYAVRYMGSMLGIGAEGLIDKQTMFYVTSNWLWYVVAFLGASPIGYTLIKQVQKVPTSRLGRQILSVGLYMGIFFIALAFLVTESFQPFLYFRF